MDKSSKPMPIEATKTPTTTIVRPSEEEEEEEVHDEMVIFSVDSDVTASSNSPLHKSSNLPGKDNRSKPQYLESLG